MKTPTFHLGYGLALILLVAISCGCATPALWKHTAAREWEPGPPDQLMMINASNQPPEVIVLFRQYIVSNGKHGSRPVTWCLSQSPTNLIIGAQAITRFTNSLAASQTIPLFTDDTAPVEASSTPPGYAAWNSTNRDFSLHLEGQPCGPDTLPATHEDTRTAMRILVFPFAIATDAAITGAAILAIGGRGYH